MLATRLLRRSALAPTRSLTRPLSVRSPLQLPGLRLQQQHPPRIPILTSRQPRLLTASFHSNPRRNDVFFVAFPALKAHLLSVTRISLVLLPFMYRYRMWKKYPRMSILILQIPIFALCIVLALALDQCPKTQRWRLLMMTAREELEWARHRFAEFLTTDGPYLLRDDDERVKQVQRVTERIISSLDQSDSPTRIISAVGFGRLNPDGSMSEEAKNLERVMAEYPPSARAFGAPIPFQLESANPTKIFEEQDWRLYVVDLPRINAFALPTREIVVYTGLIDLLEDDRLLSAVLAHEIAHVTQRHAVENAGFLSIANVGFDVLRGISFAFTVSFPFITDAAASCLNIVNDYLASRAFSRKLEMEADAIGLEFMAKAGYDPSAALALWEIMAAVEEDAAASGQAVSISESLTLLRTHPTSIQRQEMIEKLLPKAFQLYEASPYRPKGKIHPAAASLVKSDVHSTSASSPSVTSSTPSTSPPSLSNEVAGVPPASLSS